MKSFPALIRWILGGALTTFIPLSLNAGEAPADLPTRADQSVTAELAPWFTGPLIAPIGTVIPVGHYVIEPLLTIGAITGVYNSHWSPVSKPNLFNTILQIETTIGLTQFMDIQIIPEVLYNSSRGHSATLFGDLPVTLDFQLVGYDKSKWFPAVKLAITETFPTGKYKKLNAHKNNTDISGLGSFSTAPIIVLYKIYQVAKEHFLSVTASFQYTYYAPVHVKGPSVYNGNTKTHGKVYPGNLSTAIFSFEYTLTQNWVLSLDNVYNHEDKDRFRGNPGNGKKATRVGRPSSEQLSFAPAIEYNFNEYSGLIAGVWFTAVGRNAQKFCNGIVGYYYYF